MGKGETQISSLSSETTSYESTGRVLEHIEKYENLSDCAKQNINRIASYIKEDNHLTKSHTNWKLQSIHGVYAKDLIRWMQDKELTITEEDAIFYGQQLIDGGYLQASKESDSTSLTMLNNDDFYVIASPEFQESVAETCKQKRKTGFFNKSSLFHDDNVYAVVTRITNKLYLYDSDMSKSPKHVYNLENTRLQKVMNDNDTINESKIEIEYGKKTFTLEAKSQDDCDEWLEAMCESGAIYREPIQERNYDEIHSFYELKDRDMDGNIVPMSNYINKLCLIVTISATARDAERNTLELIEFYNKYYNRGLQILAFPSLNFSYEPCSTNSDLLEYIRKYHIEFPVFEKAEISGSNCRPVIGFLNEKLPKRLGLFTRSHYTKYLISRDGKPIKLLSQNYSPIYIRDEIEHQLEQDEIRQSYS